MIQLIVIMASIRIIPIVLFLSVIVVKSLHVEDIYKNSISLNGFNETDVLTVRFHIIDSGNESIGAELYPVQFEFNNEFCSPNIDYVLKSADLQFNAIVMVKFSKKQQSVQDSDRALRNIRFHVWASNRSNMEVTYLDNAKSKMFNPPTDQEKDDLKSALSQIINESPEFEMTFVGINHVLSLAEMHKKSNDTQFVVNASQG